MTPRRLLGETLSEIAAGTIDALSRQRVIAAREVTVAVPIEVALRLTPEGVSVAGEPPRTVTRTAFDVSPSRLRVVWREEART